MANREKQKRKYEPILEPIIYDEKLSAFNLRNELDLFDTTLILEDYDWMTYTLSSRLPTKAYGDIKITFMSMRVGRSHMQVKTEKKTFVFEFNEYLFEKHIIIFLQKHIRSWKENRTFCGIEEAINYYNAVLTASDTVEAPELQKLFDNN